MASKNLKFFSNIDAVLEADDWSAFRDKSDKVCDNITLGQAKALLLTDAGFEVIKNSDPNVSYGYASYNQGYYLRTFVNRFIRASISRFPQLGDQIIKKSKLPSARKYCLDNGFYSDISFVNKFAKSKITDERMFAAQHCSIDTLRTLKNDGDMKIRKIVFGRLGAVECLDEMLTDKMADIRVMGAMAAPFGYKGLEVAITKEIAKRPFAIMVSKVSTASLPLILANRNLKSRWVSKIVEERMSHATSF
jgi:hypothetical protein